MVLKLRADGAGMAIFALYLAERVDAIVLDVSIRYSSRSSKHL